MRQAATLFIFGFLLLIVVLIFMSHSLAIVQRVAVVDAINGSADLIRDGGGAPVTLAVGQLVHAGDVIRTGPEASVELRWARWAGGMRIRIGPNTKFTVKRAVTNRSTGAEESRLRVDEGSVWVRLRRALSGKSKFEVETPTAVAAVRGTIFRVTVRPGGASEISVWKGTVSVEAAKGAAVAVSEGDTVVVGEAIGAGPQPMSDAEREQWQEQTSVIGPFLYLDAPAQGAKLEIGSCTVAGRTEPDSTITINGVAAQVGKDGKFSSTVELPQGDQVVEVKAVAPDGTDTIVTVNVSVSAAQRSTAP